MAAHPNKKLVTATAKLSPNTPVGIDFVGDTDYAEITRIGENSIFRDTELEPGMKVVSINNISIDLANHAAQVIAASKSIVTILAHNAGYFGNTENFVTATARKEQPNQMVSVEYKKEYGSSRILLKTKFQTSLFANSELSSGLEIVAINNVQVLSATHANNLTSQAFPFVTILARRKKVVAVAVDPSDLPVTAAAVMAVPMSESEGAL